MSSLSEEENQVMGTLKGFKSNLWSYSSELVTTLQILCVSLLVSCLLHAKCIQKPTSCKGCSFQETGLLREARGVPLRRGMNQTSDCLLKCRPVFF